MGSQPSSNLGFGVGAGGACVSVGPFTALRLLFNTTGKRSLLSVRFTIGAVQGKNPFVFDNEKWACEVDVAPFRIASAPVTNGQYLEYVEDGGKAPRYWKKAEHV